MIIKSNVVVLMSVYFKFDINCRHMMMSYEHLLFGCLGLLLETLSALVSANASVPVIILEYSSSISMIVPAVN